MVNYQCIDFPHSLKFISFFAGALVAATATNVLLSSDAHASFPPNGWTQVGKSCVNNDTYDSTGKYTEYVKLAKTQTTYYGVYNKTKSKWVAGYKGKSLADVNAKMNTNCGVNTY